MSSLGVQPLHLGKITPAQVAYPVAHAVSRKAAIFIWMSGTDQVSSWQVSPGITTSTSSNGRRTKRSPPSCQELDRHLHSAVWMGSRLPKTRYETDTDHLYTYIEL